MEKEKENLEAFLEHLRKIIEEGEEGTIAQVDGDCICVNKSFVVSIRTPLIASLKKAWIVDMYKGIFCNLGALLVECLLEENKITQKEIFEQICSDFQMAVAA